MTYILTLSGPAEERKAIYDPATSSCTWADTGERLAPDLSAGKSFADALIVTPASPGRKVRKAKTVKIQLGLKCNYACSYCNQRAQPQDSEGNPRQVALFLERLPRWLDLGDGDGIQIEFWGGEPFVYWKTLKPVAEGVRALYPKAKFSMITNGSLLDEEKIMWLDTMGFTVAISHDGSAYADQRGDDPLLNPGQRAMILRLYEKLHPKHRVSFNCVLTRHSISLLAVREYIADHLGVPPESVPLSTEELLLPYDEDAVSLTIEDPAEQRATVHELFWEASLGGAEEISSVRNKLTDFLDAMANNRPATTLGQKCGMDRPDNIALDLNGNVMTCQNTSPLTKHRVGHAEAFDSIALTTAHHWSSRAQCTGCPVVQLCQGACLFLEDKLWDHACNTSFIYNQAMLAAALFHATKLVLTRIEGERIRHEGVTSIPVINKNWFEARLKQANHLAELRDQA